MSLAETLHPALAFGEKGCLVFCSEACRAVFEEQSEDVMRSDRFTTTRTHATDRFGNPDRSGESCSTCGTSFVPETTEIVP